MSSNAAGNTYLPFVDLMRLETINQATFQSTAQPFCPGGTHVKSPSRAYGGHVYAQAAWAAAQTVPEGFVLHVSYLHIL
jgi:acyl-CoA thioesterase